MPDASTIRVSIYDQVYHIRPADGSDAEAIEQLAAYVDSRMRAVSAQTHDVDSLRVAVLAALHIADEYHSLKRKYDALQAAVRDKSAEFNRILDSGIRRAVS